MVCAQKGIHNLCRKREGVVGVFAPVYFIQELLLDLLSKRKGKVKFYLKKFFVECEIPLENVQHT